MYHPYADLFGQMIRSGGAAGLLAPAWNRNIIREDQLSRQQLYGLPNWVSSLVHNDYEFEKTRVTITPDIHEIDFKKDRAYTHYNWELFFHVPFFIAESMRRAGRYSEAKEWLEYIFDPTSTESWDETKDQYYPKNINGKPVSQDLRYWRFRPFLSNAKSSIQKQLENLSAEETINEYNEWLNNPFDPHVIASIRISAYQKAIVMRYLDNLLEWGDCLFRQHNRESINEATQLYILAAEILGERPRELAQTGQRTPLSYKELKTMKLDDFSNVLVQLENLMPQSDTNGEVAETNVEETLSGIPALYFCVPPNPELIEYWKKVEDRLYKIRHCLDIEGRERALPLWEPEIDPEILVRATAAGVDIDTVLADMDAPLGYYRFNMVLQKAQALVATTRQLGNALLSALEKRDAEELATLRSGLELDLQEAVLEVRQSQLKEARANITAAKASKRVIEERKNHYDQLNKVGLIPQEEMQLLLLQMSREMQADAEWSEKFASTMAIMPNISLNASTTIGEPPSETVGGGFSFGGSNLSALFSAVARGRYSVAKALEYHANRMSIDASHVRRADDWTFQSKLAEREIQQLEKQIVTAEIREAIADTERKNQRLQIKNARQVYEWMQDKYTNQELYDWMHGQLQSLYYQSYNLAYDMAKRAERCLRHELGITDPAPFIEYGNWDNQRQGLLAAERLQGQLERLEVAYMENNRRELELRKNISLALLDPVALSSFRETGVCFFSLPEVLFDLELPGHYLRRLKSVSLTIPAVTGPYTNISATLTMQYSWIRRQANSGDLEMETGVTDSIVTSSGRQDAGVFNLNQEDPRYLPFERRGAISDWKLELTEVFPSFDRKSITDVVIHLEYTARDGGKTFRSERRGTVQSALNTLTRKLGPNGIAQSFNVSQEFPDVWHRFINDQAGNTTRTLTLDLTQEHLLYMFRKTDPAPKVHHIAVMLQTRSQPPAATNTNLKVNLGAAQANELQLSKETTGIEGPLFGYVELYDDHGPPKRTAPQPWGPITITMPSDLVDKDEICGMTVIVFYGWP